jgi:hypothetical protein
MAPNPLEASIVGIDRLPLIACILKALFISLILVSGVPGAARPDRGMDHKGGRLGK